MVGGCEFPPSVSLSLYDPYITLLVNYYHSKNSGMNDIENARGEKEG